MNDAQTPPATTSGAHQLVGLLFEQGQEPLRYLRPAEAGAAYYDLSGVERAVDPAVQSEEQMQTVAERRTWEPLGAVYLLAHTRQTLRWSDSPVPASYHVGRVPEAAAYRFIGQEHEYTFTELVARLERGPAAFRGYPVAAGAGGHEPRIQFTPAQPGEANSESGGWVQGSKWLRAGREDVRDGVHYQRYDEVQPDGIPVGRSYIGQRTAEGEWLSESGSAESVGKWLKRSGAASGVNF